jgi:hypothetical protein
MAFVVFVATLELAAFICVWLNAPRALTNLLIALIVLRFVVAY